MSSLTGTLSQLGDRLVVESERSELLQTWTQALIPPFVQIRLVKVCYSCERVG